tara:strand:- start:1044 stop:1784 length:741 start_codon:yes stop_codon:yes gene_type:complete
MRTILFKKNGSLHLVDKVSKEVEKVDTIINYLDCPVELEAGITFKTFFNHVIKEKDFLNILFKETMKGSSIDVFLKEWDKKGKSVDPNKGIQFLKAYKIFDYIQLNEEKDFIDIRVDFDGIGNEEQLYNLEFIPLNELKNIPMVISENMSIYRTVSNLKGEELFFRGNSFVLLFELLGTVLYVLTIHKSPEGRNSAKEKFIQILGNTNIIEMLEEQKEDAVEIQNFEEAAQLKKILDRLQNGFTNE